MSYSACNIWKAHVYSQVLKLFIWSVWGENIQETNNLPTKTQTDQWIEAVKWACHSKGNNPSFLVGMVTDLINHIML